MKITRRAIKMKIKKLALGKYKDSYGMIWPNSDIVVKIYNKVLHMNI